MQRRARSQSTIDWSTRSERARLTRHRAILRELKAVTITTPERQLQRIGDALANVYGWLTHHNPDSRRVQPGLPDSLYLHEILLAVEYKARAGRLRPQQAQWIARLNNVAPQRVIALLIGPSEMDQLAFALRRHGAWAPSPPHTKPRKGNHGSTQNAETRGHHKAS